MDIRETNFKFGIARGGHSGGYWYIPKTSETDGKLVFEGEILRSGSDFNAAGDKKKSNKLAEVFIIILSPIILLMLLLVEIYILVKSLIRRIRREPVVKADTPEDRLYSLMETTLGCMRM